MSMERKDVRKLDSLLEQFVKAHGLERGLAEYRLVKAWSELLGVTIAKKTKSLRIKNRKLFVSLHSSVVRNELSLIKDTLIPKLNEAAGMDVIDDVILR
jgi:predicted nucleic acid-binding Zn ribbon protein